MGTFEGHVIPGTIYAGLALWWGFVTAIKYARTQKIPNARFKGGTTMPCFWCPTKKLRTFPIESFFKLAGITTHSIFELVCGSRYTAEGRWYLGYENAHHICMLSGFLVSSLIEILMYYRVPFPKFTDYMFNLLAFLIQSLVMITHLEGDNDLEHIVHKLWTILCFLSFVGGLAETIKPDYYWAVYMRIFFFLAQGTWMFQIAFVVWPQTTNPAFIWHADHASHVWLTVSMMYHLIGCALALMIQYVFVYSMIGTIDKFYRRYEFDIEQDEQEQTFREKTTSASYRILLNETDENEKEQLI